MKSGNIKGALAVLLLLIFIAAPVAGAGTQIYRTLLVRLGEIEPFFGGIK